MLNYKKVNVDYNSLVGRWLVGRLTIIHDRLNTLIVLLNMTPREHNGWPLALIAFIKANVLGLGSFEII